MRRIAFCAIAALFLFPYDSLLADHPTGAFSSGGAGPINTYSAATLPRGGLAASLRLEYLNSTGSATPNCCDSGNAASRPTASTIR